MDYVNFVWLCGLLQNFSQSLGTDSQQLGMHAGIYRKDSVGERVKQKSKLHCKYIQFFIVSTFHCNLVVRFTLIALSSPR